MPNVLKAALLGAIGLVSGAVNAADIAQVEVDKGRQLFMSPTLSASGAISCASCHPGGGHTDNKTYVGLDVVADGDPKGRSTPTLWNAGRRSVYAWAGTVPALEANIRGIIVNRMKGAEPAPEVLAALSAYVRSLTPPKSGSVDPDGTPAPNAPAPVKRGFELFVGAGGCGSCHVPGSFDKAGPEDIGTDGKFKVPSLWAVSKTAPYFHDGRTKDLGTAVKVMWEFDIPKPGKSYSPTDAQVNDLLAYLNAL